MGTVYTIEEKKVNFFDDGLLTTPKLKFFSNLLGLSPAVYAIEAS